MTLLSSEDLVERVARLKTTELRLGVLATLTILTERYYEVRREKGDTWPLHEEAYEKLLDHFAAAAIAVFPDLSVLQGEVERLRAALKPFANAFVEAGEPALATAAQAATMRDYVGAFYFRQAHAALSLLPDLGEEQTVSRSQPISDGLRPTTSGSEPSGA